MEIQASNKLFDVVASEWLHVYIVGILFFNCVVCMCVQMYFCIQRCRCYANIKPSGIFSISFANTHHKLCLGCLYAVPIGLHCTHTNLFIFIHTHSDSMLCRPLYVQVGKKIYQRSIVVYYSIFDVGKLVFRDRKKEHIEKSINTQYKWYAHKYMQ